MSRFTSFLARLRDHDSDVCIDDGGRPYSYAQLLEEMAQWQARFDQFDVMPGTVVGIRADFSFSAIAALLALFERRVIVALIPGSHDASVYVRNAFVSKLLEFRAQGDYRCRPTPVHRGHPLLETLRTSGEGGIVIFTSGSTGLPKAALQSVERFLYKFQQPGRRLRTLAFLLFDHVAGMDTLFYTLTSGGTLILPTARDARSVLRLIESSKVEVLPTSPSFLRLMCAAADSAGYDLSSLKVVTYGAEPMDPSTLRKVNVLLPSAQIIQKYGTTETGSPRTASRGNDSLWIKIKGEGVETKIVDDVLWIRSEGTVLGYLNAPSPIDAAGWYCTGDIVDVDGEWYRFRGRTADLINVGGEKVAPAEVEQIILELGFVRDAVVSGESNALMGQIVTARVVLAEQPTDARDLIRRIRTHCRQRMPSHKVPVKIEIVADGLTNARQKAQRRGASGEQVQ